MLTALKATGASAGVMNRRLALSTPIHTAPTLINASSGIMIRVSFTANSTLAASPAKPSEIAWTSGRANTKPSPVNVAVTTSATPSTSCVSRCAAASPSRSRAAVKVGTKALDRAPSASRSRRRLGIRKATWNASATAPPPNSAANNDSRTRPRTRDAATARETRPDWRRVLTSSLCRRATGLGKFPGLSGTHGCRRLHLRTPLHPPLVHNYAPK